MGLPPTVMAVRQRTALEVTAEMLVAGMMVVPVAVTVPLAVSVTGQSGACRYQKKKRRQG